MPQISQLPVAVNTSGSDVVPLNQNGHTVQVPLGTLFAETQSSLTLAGGTLLGRVSFGAGGPEPVTIGTGLALQNGVLSVSGVQGPKGDLGPQGPQGLAGPLGATGASLHSGAFAPDMTVGLDGDTFINTRTGDISQRVAGIWNIVGNFQGAPGRSLWSGAAAPTVATGSDNDTYINTANGDLFTRANGVWTKIMNIMGTPGRSMWNGTGAPAPLLGVAGDSYIDTASGNLWSNQAGTWARVNNIMGVPGRSLWTGTSAPAATLGADGDSFVNTATGDYWTRVAGAWNRATNISGAPGKSLWNGTSAPASSLGSDGDSYLNTGTGDLYARAGGVWAKAANINGTPGRSLLSGTAAPAANIGNEGDSYINTATGDLYTRAGGVWGRAANITGPSGRSLWSGMTAPAANVGSDGDSYINTATGDLYTRAGGAWSRAANITGPSGRSMWSGTTGPGSALGADGDSYINTATADLWTRSGGIWTRASNLAGAAGKSLWNGTGAPAASLGQSGDSYVNSATGDLWAKSGGTWSQAGNLTGAAGRSMWSGTSAPAGTLGQGGDSYINTATGDLYANSAGAWSKVSNLMGTPGRSMWSGNTTPPGGYGLDGDSWINVTAGDIYTRSGGIWSKASNIIGPAGKSLLTGTAAPSVGVGNDGDTFLNTATGDLYNHAAGLWNKTSNITGAPGKSLLTGTASPSVSQGGDGDSFINTVTGDLWSRSSGTWTQVNNIIGRSMRNGTTAPNSAIGYDGDSYLNTATGDVYTRNAGAWSKASNIVGATGKSLWNGTSPPPASLGNDGDSFINTSTADIYTRAGGVWTRAANFNGAAANVPTATLLGGANNTFATVALGNGLKLAGNLLQADTTVLAPAAAPVFTGSVQMPDGSTAAPAIAFSSAPGTGLTHYAAGAGVGHNMGIVLGNAEIGTWGSGGDPTTSPAGLVLRSGPLVINAQNTWGYLNTAVGLSVVTNSGPVHQAQVMGGFTNLYGSGGPAKYAGRDSVTAYFENNGPAPALSFDNCTFTATTLVPAFPFGAAALALLKTNMLIDTSHSPKYTGIIQSWTANAITVSGWVQVGNTNTGQVPPGSASAYINPVTKIWALNANVALGTNSYATAAAGFELGVNNNTGAYNSATDSPKMWGYDAVNLGNATVSCGFICRGDMQNDYVATTGRNAAFCYMPSGAWPLGDGFQTQQSAGTGFHVMGNMATGTGFWTQQLGGMVLSASDVTHGQKFAISATDGSIDIGAQGQGMRVSAAAVAVGGSGYAAGDTITLANGTLLKVATAAGGAVASVTVSSQGSWPGLPSGAQAQTASSGNGTGATFTLTLVASTTGSTPSIDFHTTGAAETHNARIGASGGTLGVVGSGSLDYIAAQHQFTDVAGSGFTLTGGSMPTLASSAGFSITGAAGAALTGTGGGSLILATASGGIVTVQGGLMAPAGQIELGSQNGTASPAFVDFHNTGGNEDFSARINATGGAAGTTGSATLKLTAAAHMLVDPTGGGLTVTPGSAPAIASSGGLALTGASGAAIAISPQGAVSLTPAGSAFLNLGGPVAALSGQIELGAQTGTATRAYIDFHSTAGGEDYTVRVMSVAGVAGVTGSGTLQVNATGLTVAGTGALLPPSGTTAQQPASPVAGMLRYNSTTARTEFYAAGATNAWVSHVRLSGDAMSGPLAVPSLASSGAITAPAIAAPSGTVALGAAGASGGGVVFLGAQGDGSYWKAMPANGATVAIPANVSTVQLVPASPLASLTVTLPAGAFDGQWIYLTSTQTIAALTLTGGTVTNAPAGLAAGSTIELQCQAGAWFCQNASGIAAIAGGTIDGTAIGSATPASGAFTTLAASGPTVLSGTLSTGTVTVANTNSAVLAAAASGPVSLAARGTNVGLALIPAGSGALMAAIANGAASGGNARGNNATDWQQVRATAAQVASGLNATIVGGANNLAAGSNSTAGGNSNTVAGNNATAFGNGNALTGAFSVAPGGYQANDNGLYGSAVFASGMFARQGDAQTGLRLLRAATTGATAARLTADGASAGAANVLNLPNKGAYAFGRIVVLAFDNAGYNAAMWHVDGLLVTRGAAAAATTIVGTPAVTLVQASSGLASLAAGSLAVSADTANGGVNFTITGTATPLHVVMRAATAEAA